MNFLGDMRDEVLYTSIDLRRNDARPPLTWLQLGSLCHAFLLETLSSLGHQVSAGSSTYATTMSYSYFMPINKRYNVAFRNHE